MGCLPVDLNETADGSAGLLLGRTPLVFLRNAQAECRPPPLRRSKSSPSVKSGTPMRDRRDVDGDGHAISFSATISGPATACSIPRRREGIEMQHSMSRADTGAPVRLLLWKEAPLPFVSFRDRAARLLPI